MKELQGWARAELEVAGERIREVQVRATMVGGVFGYDAEGELSED